MRNCLLIILLTAYSTLFSQSYTGITTRQVNLRSGPGTNFEKLASLPPGSQIFIASLIAENDFYTIIDIKTNIEGFVHRDYVKIKALVPVDSGVFTKNGQIESSNPLVEVYNRTNLDLTLKMNNDYHYFKPYERKSLNFEPGVYTCRASAPGVQPYLAKENLGSNQSYSWEFYIVRR